MKKIFCLLVLLAVVLSGCSASDGQSDSNIESHSHSSNINSDSQNENTEEKKDFMTDAKKVISTLDYSNYGKMGDVDGPAFVVYSKQGYNAASVKLDVDAMEIKTVLPDDRFINAYAFLGIDVYSSEGWINCVDAGLCWSGTDGGWHIFYNMFHPLNPDTPTWYESSKKLPKNDKYTLTLEITRDNYATVTVVGEKHGAKDSKEFEVMGAKADGSATGLLFNVALDYPPNTKLDRNGNYCEDDWVEITLANSDKGMGFRSCHAYDLTLFKGGKAYPWTEEKNEAVSIWPDKKVKGFDYAPTRVGLSDGTEYWIDLNMNR